MNWKRFAIKFADLKDQSTYNQINKVFGYLVDFPMGSYPNPGFTSTKAELIYQWTLTISETDLSEKVKVSIMSDAIDDLLTNQDDKKNLKDILFNSTLEAEVITKELISSPVYSGDVVDIPVPIQNFLPITFFDDENQNDDFILNTISAFQNSYKNNNHQFAYIAYYMLFMSYLYKITWELKTIGDTTIQKQIENFVQNKLERDLNIIFDFSIIGEDSFCRNINTFVRCLHPNEIQEMVNFVEKRNHCAHPSGMIQYTPQEVDNLILKINQYTSKIQSQVDKKFCSYLELNLNAFGFDKRFLLSPNEITHLYNKRDIILNFPSDSAENLEKKLGFLRVLLGNNEQVYLSDILPFESIVLLLNGYSHDNPYSIYDIIQLLGPIDSTNAKLITDHVTPLLSEKDKSEGVLDFLQNQ